MEKHGEAPAAARVVKIDVAPATAEASEADGDASEKGRYVTAWVPDSEETEQQATLGRLMLMCSLSDARVFRRNTAAVWVQPTLCL